MRVFESTFVGLLDEKPPYWFYEGKEVPPRLSFIPLISRHLLEVTVGSQTRSGTVHPGHS
jgi:hypothetical protein